jgi:predicted metalloprotease
MRWRGRRQSENVEDRRGMLPQMAVGGGALLLIGIMIAGKVGGCDAAQIQQAVNVAKQVQQKGGAAQQAPAGEGIDDEASQFVEVILADTEEVWSTLFRDEMNGADYPEPQLILFQGSVATGGCGTGSEGMGPFYCPGDQKVYVPPSFFDELARRHDAPGDFAQAYVIAHEVAHHVQNVLGLNKKLKSVQASGDEQEINRQSVWLELQADYLAGAWSYHAQKQFNILEDGDIEEAINTAKQIGDDTLQMKSQGRTVPAHYTHGTSAQRMRWFHRGMRTGNLNECLRLAELPYDEL